MLGHRSKAEETDRALNALSHICRRRLLFELYDEVNSGKREPISYTGITPLRTERKQEHILLDHAHLPKLEEFEYIKWNKAEKTIQMGPLWEEIEPLLRLINSHQHDLSPLFQGIPTDKDGTKS